MWFWSNFLTITNEKSPEQSLGSTGDTKWKGINQDMDSNLGSSTLPQKRPILQSEIDAGKLSEPSCQCRSTSTRKGGSMTCPDSLSGDGGDQLHNPRPCGGTHRGEPSCQWRSTSTRKGGSMTWTGLIVQRRRRPTSRPEAWCGCACLVDAVNDSNLATDDPFDCSHRLDGGGQDQLTDVLQRDRPRPQPANQDGLLYQRKDSTIPRKLCFFSLPLLVIIKSFLFTTLFSSSLLPVIQAWPLSMKSLHSVQCSRDICYSLGDVEEQ